MIRLNSANLRPHARNTFEVTREAAMQPFTRCWFREA